MANTWIQHLKSESARLKISYRDAMKDKRVKDSYKAKKTDTLQSAIKPIPALRQKGRLVVGGKSKPSKTLDEEIQNLEEIDTIPIKTTPIIPPKPVKTIPVIPPKPEKLVKLVKTMKNIQATKIQKAFRKKQSEKAEEELTQMIKDKKSNKAKPQPKRRQIRKSKYDGFFQPFGGYRKQFMRIDWKLMKKILNQFSPDHYYDFGQVILNGLLKDKTGSVRDYLLRYSKYYSQEKIKDILNKVSKNLLDSKVLGGNDTKSMEQKESLPVPEYAFTERDYS
jgi:hypothetical protein